MASGDSNGSLAMARVVVDSIDMNSLATNVLGHLLRKNPRVTDNQLETAGVRVHTLDDIKCGGGDEPDTDVPDGPGSGNGEDQPDYPGEGLTLDVVSTKTKQKRVAACLLQIADDLDQRTDLWDLVQDLDITPETAYETFSTVAMEIFSHGVSWGKIAVLFVFAAHCVVRAIVNNRVVNIVRKWANFVARFIGAELTEWIRSAGGWGSLVESPPPAFRMGTVIVVSLVLGVILKTIWDRGFTSLFSGVSRTRTRGLGIYYSSKNDQWW